MFTQSLPILYIIISEIFCFCSESYKESYVIDSMVLIEN